MLNLKTIHSFSVFIKRYCFKKVYNMDNAYLMRVPETGQYKLSFHYVNSDEKINRQFNFCRQLSENVDTLLNRIATNVNKIKSKKKKKLDVCSSSAVITVKLMDENQDISPASVCESIFHIDNNLTLAINKNIFKVIIDSPWVESFSLPQSMLTNFLTYPNFESVNTNIDLSEFTWYISQDKLNWKEVEKGFTYLPKSDAINSFVKVQCIPKNDRICGPIVETESKNKILAGPENCPFETRQSFTKEKLTCDRFRIVTYNILADLYCDSDYTRDVLHPYCPPHALSIDYRKQLILKELLGYNSDIICLQEVDRKLFKNDLLTLFSKMNYDGELSLKGGQVSEGSAIFYNKKRFCKLDSHRIVFSENLEKNPIFTKIWNKISENSQLQKRIMELGTTLQTVVLKSLENEKILILANIHLYFHPDADHIRLLQAGLSIIFLEDLLNKMKKKDNNINCAIVFCGDFNSTPECGIYKLITTGSVSETSEDYKSNAEEVVQGLHLQHNVPLRSACGTPKYTNFTKTFADCLDYIFYDPSKLIVDQVVPLPSIDELSLHTALPSIVFPSDHISLIADLKWL